MFTTRILDALQACTNVAPLLACVLLIALASTPLHSQAFTDFWDFECENGGCNPLTNGQLVQGTDGKLYGTLSAGGAFGSGGLWSFDPVTNQVTGYQFSWMNGFYAGLTLASDGNFYGTTMSGGDFNQGTVFRFTLPATLTVLHSFNGTDGAGPLTPPVQGADGNLYGVTGSGTTYRIILQTGNFVQLPNNTPSATEAQLMLASDGNLYGASLFGGTSDAGTIFRMTTAGAIKVIYNFTGINDGFAPEGPLAQGADGNLYGTTEGSSGNVPNGSVFKLSLSGQFTVLHDFDLAHPCGQLFCNNDGGDPIAGVVPASDGNFYGITPGAGSDGYGTLFELTSVGTFSKLFDFTWYSGLAQGAFSGTTLVQHTNGCLYGLAPAGGANGVGDAFSLCLSRGIPILKIVGPIFVHPGVPVQVLGNNLTQAFSVAFAGENTSFRAGADTVLTAQVPQDAVDGPIAVTYVTGLQVQTLSPIYILPVINNLDPTSGPPGTQVGVVGGGFARASKVTIGGVKASFTVVNPTLIQAIVPANAKTGKVVVTTPNGTAKSRQTFTIT